ncbi:MAG: hypothetical protein U0S12_14780 [Fimbriimonadales bacterium]
MITQVLVGMADIEVVKGRSKLVVPGLGSGVGILALDPTVDVAGAAYVLLPGAGGTNSEKPGRYAETAVPTMIDMMCRLGATPENLRVALLGAAEATASGTIREEFRLGAKTVETIVRKFDELGVQGVFQDTGGASARTASLDVETGDVTVETTVGLPAVACCLRSEA